MANSSTRYRATPRAARPEQRDAILHDTAMRVYRLER